jgi:amino acid transporter
MPVSPGRTCVARYRLRRGPSPAWVASVVLIVSNFMAYTGMEMNAVHVNSMKDPRREFPKTMFFALVLVLLILILPPLAISWVIPSSEISLTAGVMQAISAAFANFGLS